MIRRLLALGLVVVLSTGCYHATIETGATPSMQVIEKPWASGWIYGLVPPSTVATAQQCTNGVAKIETQLSFANQLVNFLTGGIYTPMSIKVTCAQGRTSDAHSTIRSTGNGQEAIHQAAELSARERAPVLVQF